MGLKLVIVNSKAVQPNTMAEGKKLCLKLENYI